MAQITTLKGTYLVITTLALKLGCVWSVLVLLYWLLWVDAVSLVLIVVCRLTNKRYILPLVDDLRIRIHVRLQGWLLRSEFGIVRSLALEFGPVRPPFILRFCWFLHCSFWNKLRIVLSV